MISFLKSKGYDVLNLIEIRKPFKNETNKTEIKVSNNIFKYYEEISFESVWGSYAKWDIELQLYKNRNACKLK